MRTHLVTRPPGRARVTRIRRLALGAAVFGALLFGALPPMVAPPREAADGPDGVHALGSLRPAATVRSQGLPREWRWSPPGIEYEHMFRRPG